MKPLKGIRIVELATFVAGPQAAHNFAEWGAEVIKVESGSGDPLRRVGGLTIRAVPEVFNPQQDATYDMNNSNKKFLSLDLKTEEGHNIMLNLLGTADAFITNYRNAALDALGLTYEQLHPVYPKLVYGHVLGYGDKGPLKDAPGFDYTSFAARGGILSSYGQEGGDPANGINSAGDLPSAMTLSAGVCAGILGARLNGHGSYVTTSLYSTAMYSLGFAVAGAHFGEKFPKNRRTDPMPFTNTYRGSDDAWIQLCNNEHDRSFNKMMKLIGREDLLDNEKFGTVKAMNENNARAELIAIMEGAIAAKTADEWVDIFNKADITISKCFTVRDIMNDEQAWANNYLRTYKYPSGYEMPYVANPIHFDDEADYEFIPSRPQGSDNAEILKSLGYSAEEIEKYQNTNILIAK